MPKLSLYISLNWVIGNGFSPIPDSIVYPGLLYFWINQSLKPAKLEVYGVSASKYPLDSANFCPISRLYDGL